uniref:IDEAL domain-containing protein n=1 Tax=Meloidogyne hapla TaxID=6305 RepID=A0A1I8B656_MELHA
MKTDKNKLEIFNEMEQQNSELINIDEQIAMLRTTHQEMFSRLIVENLNFRDKYESTL